MEGLEFIAKISLFCVICFFICMIFFVPTIKRIEALERLHNEYICLDCGTLVKK